MKKFAKTRFFLVILHRFLWKLQSTHRILSSFTERFSRVWCSLPGLIRRTKRKPQRIVQQAMIKLWILLQENEGALEGARTFHMDICIINKLLFCTCKIKILIHRLYNIPITKIRIIKIIILVIRHHIIKESHSIKLHTSYKVM